MNIYIESNFVLELTLLQEDHDNCERILSLCENGQAKLILPAYAFIEPNETLIRYERERTGLANAVASELNQLGRSFSYKTEADTYRPFVSLLTRSGAEQRQRLIAVSQRLLRIAELIPLDISILTSSFKYQTDYNLSPQDAVIFASVMQHLSMAQISTTSSCFIDRDKHFADLDIREILAEYDCKILFSFKNGYSYIQSQI